MKHKLIFVIIILCTILTSISGTRINVKDDFDYRRAEMLSRVNGMLGPSPISPQSSNRIATRLSQMDPTNLSPVAKETYTTLVENPTRKGAYLSDGVFSSDMSISTSFSISTPVPSWENKGSLGRDLRTELIPFREIDPFLKFKADLMFFDNLVLEFSLPVGNNQRRSYITSLGFLAARNSLGGWDTVFNQSEASENAISGEFPQRAGMMFANNYVSLILGRFPHEVGQGISGNLLIGNNFDYQEVLLMSFYSKMFSYDISITHFDNMKSIVGDDGKDYLSLSRSKFQGPQQMRILHKFSFALWDKLRISLDLMTLHNGEAMDIRYFFPFVFQHNYYNYDNHMEKLYYDEANNMLGLSVEWALPLGFSLYGEFALDQLQLPIEDGSAIPSAFGFLINVKNTTDFQSFILDSGLEFVYTNPYLYLNGKYSVDKNSGKRVYDDNLDYILGYSSQYLPQYGYTGYIYGPDTMAVYLENNFLLEDFPSEYSLGLLFRVQGQNRLRHKTVDGVTMIDMSNSRLEDENGKNPESTPSGGWRNAEYLVRPTFTGKLYLGRHYEIKATAVANFYIEKGVFTFLPQVLVNFKMTY